VNQLKSLIGKWRIAGMEVWDQEYVDMEVPGFISIDAEGMGRFQFGLVSGDIDGQMEQYGDTQRFEFSWFGQDENDPINGWGWAIIQHGELIGHIYLHHADNSGFRASKKK
jgi:hypothetical protein